MSLLNRFFSGQPFISTLPKYFTGSIIVLLLIIVYEYRKDITRSLKSHINNYWFVSIDTVEDARKATRIGVYGILAYTVMMIVSVVWFLTQGTVPNASTGTLEDTAIGFALYFLIFAIGAWQFWKGEGLVVGILILMSLGFGIATDIADNTVKVGSLFVYFAVACLLINGIRGAWAMRKFRISDHDKIRSLEQEIEKLKHMSKTPSDIEENGHIEI